MINLDSEDPAGLASFYSAVLGWNVLHSEGDYAMIGDGSDQHRIREGARLHRARLARGVWTEALTTLICMWTISTQQSNKRSTSVPASRPSSRAPIGGAYCWIRCGHPFDICLKS
jgi:hypothetical protein